ncbi:MAG: NADP-dependent phosphogluconate dehydrogenase [Planctomycetota bacterium]
MSTTTVATADVGLIGLAVMGQNLVLNMADHGRTVAVYNRTGSVTDAFIADNPPDVFGDGGGGLVGCASLEDFIQSLRPPRIIILLVKAGPAVDIVCQSLLDAGLEPDDIVVDGGNSKWTDTIRRENDYRGKFVFFGSGVSGGETGARFGPSLMPGGDRDAWTRLKPLWEDIAAKVDPSSGKPLEGATPGNPIAGGEPCTTYIGANGAGHYVKMVHNGIEYADMQLICEAYHLLRELGGMEPAAIGNVFTDWNAGDLDSFLIEITADILKQSDPQTGKPFVDIVLDRAGQKGTGAWTAIDGLDKGSPVPSIAEAVFARSLSSRKDERVRASSALVGPSDRPAAPRTLIDDVRQALYCSKICAYAQGFALMRAAEEEYDWELDLGAIAGIFRGGCIIRARFLQKITDAYARDAALPNLLLDPFFTQQITDQQAAWRRVVALATQSGVPCPAFASSLAYYDGYRTETLPANLLQAQRDYFGAHTYERTDAPRGTHFHLDWPHPDRPQEQA